MAKVFRVNRRELEKVFKDFDTLKTFEQLLATVEDSENVTLVEIRDDIDANTVRSQTNEQSIDDLQTDKANLVDPVFPNDITVNNNVNVVGSVDGRDVGADGLKLDSIEAGATGDQTGAEIKALYEGELDTNAFTDAEKTKLVGIEAGATDDQTGAEIKALYEAEADTNAFTDDEKLKLSGIEDNATADQTGAEIKALYEVEPNAFTDADKTKLVGIEDGATVDQTGAEIKALYEAEADTNAFTDDEKSDVATISSKVSKPTRTTTVPATGFSLSFTQDDSDQWLVLDPAAGLATGTITLVAPAQAIDGQELTLTTTEQVAAITIDGNGASVYGAPGALRAESSLSFRYESSLTAWVVVP